MTFKHKETSGFILFSTLMLITSLSFLSLSIHKSFFYANKSLSSFIKHKQCYYLALSGLNVSKKLINNIPTIIYKDKKTLYKIAKTGISIPFKEGTCYLLKSDEQIFSIASIKKSRIILTQKLSPSTPPKPVGAITKL